MKICQNYEQFLVFSFSYLYLMHYKQKLQQDHLSALFHQQFFLVFLFFQFFSSDSRANKKKNMKHKKKFTIVEQISLEHFEEKKNLRWWHKERKKRGRKKKWKNIHRCLLCSSKIKNITCNIKWEFFSICGCDTRKKISLFIIYTQHKNIHNV